MEHISTTTLIVTLLIMVVISAYFSGSETGMMTLNRYRLRHRAKQGNRQAKRVEKLLRKPDRLISLVLIGNNLVNILASALGTIVGMRLYGDAGVAIATGVLTFVVLVFAGSPADSDDAVGMVTQHHHAAADAHDGHQNGYRSERFAE